MGEDNGTDLEYTEDGDTATQDSEGTDGEGSGKKRKAGAMKKSKKRGKIDSTGSAPTSTARRTLRKRKRMTRKNLKMVLVQKISKKVPAPKRKTRKMMPKPRELKRRHLRSQSKP